MFGLESTGIFSHIDISVMPCNFDATLPIIGGLDDRISDECQWDLQAQIDYIKPPNIIALYNQERLNMEKYGG